MKTSTLKFNLLSTKTQIGKLAKIASTLGCPVIINSYLGYSCYMEPLVEDAPCYVNLESAEFDNLEHAFLCLLHELGHHIECQVTQIGRETSEDIICCEILAWINGIGLAKEHKLVLPSFYKKCIRYHLYTYCIDDSRCKGEYIDPFTCPKHPHLKEQGDMFLERL